MERTRFQAGCEHTAAQWLALDAQLREVLACQIERRLMVFHAARVSLAHRYGLQQIPIEGEGKAPASQALAAIVEKSRTAGVRVVCVQKRYSRRAADAVAPIIGGEAAERGPLADDLVGSMRCAMQAVAPSMR